MINANRETPKDAVAIIGLGCLFPRASSNRAFWLNIKGGVDAIDPIPQSRFALDDYHDGDPKSPDRTYATRGGFLSETPFDPMHFGMAPNTLEATDTSQLLGMVAAERALRDAGYGPDRDFDRDKVSVIVGVTGSQELVIPLGARLGHPIWRRALKDSGVDPKTADEVVHRIADSYVPWQENSFPGLLGNVVAGRIASRFDLGGTNCVTDAACASSLSALHLANLELSSGRSDMVITGGVDTFSDIFMYMCFSKTPALSPDGHAKPFSANADGTTLGEGIGLVVIKRLEDAQRDGDRVYAVIRGMGSSSDGRGEAIYAPSSDGQVKALRRAYEDAGVSPSSIELVEAHATGTKVGDEVEARALQSVFSEASASNRWCAIGSIKSQIGHTKAAAGAAGLIKAALALHHKVIPPTIKVDQPIPALADDSSPFYVCTEKRPWVRSEQPRRAAVSAFGFGGTNFHCVLEEHGEQRREVDWDPSVDIVAFSGISVVEDFEAWTRLDAGERSAAARDSRARFDASAPERLVVIVDPSSDDLAGLLGRIQQTAKSQTDASSWSIPEGVFFGRGQTAGKTAAMFPGQGSQYVGMMRDLACAFPCMLETLEQANDVFARHRGSDPSSRRLSDYVFPRPAFSDEERHRQAKELETTDVAQPAIGAISLGALRVLRSFGFDPDAYAGHSFGELVALCAAGRFEAESFHELSHIRGKLMSSGEGGMLAVTAPLKDVEALIEEEALNLVIANRNAPSQAVLSGPTEDIERAEHAVERRGWSGVRLKVAAAFHSELVAEATKPFREALERVPIGATEVPVFANVTATAYPSDAPDVRALLASQIAEPVLFENLIEEMYESGVRTFVDVGPGGSLSGLISAILSSRPHHIVSLDRTKGRKPGLESLARVVGELGALGHPVSLDAWMNVVEDERPAPRGKGRLTIPIGGGNHRSTKSSAPPPRSQAPVSNATAANEVVAPRPAPLQGPTTPSVAPAPQAPQASIPASPIPQVHGEASRSFLDDALRSTHENLMAQQRLQEQAAALHKQFLDHQLAHHRTFQGMIEQQQRLFLTLLGEAPPSDLARPMPPLPSAPPPIASAPPAAPLHSPMAVPPSPAPMATPPPVAPIPQAAPQAPAAPAPSPQAPAEPIGVDMAGVLLGVVADSTGYPRDVLNLDMSLDEDLGIDSIKRVEILAALSEKVPGLESLSSDQLGTLRTLRDVVERLGGSGEASLNGSAVESQAQAASANGSASNHVGVDMEDALLSVVADSTGYPRGVLTLEMSLDEDLGIDSIKRVEILAALSERVAGLASLSSDRLGTLRTLQDVVDRLAPQGVQENAPSSTSETVANDVTAVLLKAVADSTGYPVEMLNVEMSLEADLGIDSIKRVEILAAIQERLPETPALKPDELGRLESLGDIVALLSASEAPTNTKPSTKEEAPKSAPASSNGIEVLPAAEPEVARHVVRLSSVDTTTDRVSIEGTLAILGDASFGKTLASALRNLGVEADVVAPDAIPADAAGLVVVAPDDADGTFLREALIAVKQASVSLRKRSNALLVTVTRSGGAFGFEGSFPSSQAVGSGLAGLAKTAAQEWPEVHCRAIDLPQEGFDAWNVFVDAMTFRGDQTEVGIGPDGKIRTTELVRIPGTPGSSPLSQGDVVLVTGGARGVTAASCLGLAKVQPLTFVMLGRSEQPSDSDALYGMDDEASIKAELVKRGGGRLTPKEIEAAYRRLMAEREVRQTLQALRDVGSQVHYRQVDVRDREAVSVVIGDVRQTVGEVQGVIHGAGVLRDQRIEDKDPSAFDLVYETKVEGWNHVVDALQNAPLKMIALFSSATARFGRVGQVDYAMANEVLNKTARVEAHKRPGCRVVSFGWGPWDGGMVTPALKALFAKEGMEAIPLEAGGRFFATVLGEQDDVEVVALATTEPSASELHVAFERDVDVQSHPILASHLLGGRPVFPMALMVELLAHGALHRNPGFQFDGLEDLRVLKGLVLRDGNSVSMRVLASDAESDSGVFKVTCEIRSIQQGKEILHARARVVLTNSLAKGAKTLDAVQGTTRFGDPAAIYDVLFHGPDLQCLETVEASSEDGLVARVQCAQAPSTWINNPLRGRWLADPSVLDGVFQAMILWCVEHRGSLSLPTSLGRYQQFVSRFPKDRVRAVIRVREASSLKARADVELLAMDGDLVARLEGYECAMDEGLSRAFERPRAGASG